MGSVDGSRGFSGWIKSGGRRGGAYIDGEDMSVRVDCGRLVGCAELTLELKYPFLLFSCSPLSS